MVSTASVIGIALVALGMVLTPGPNMIYLVSRSITQGVRAGLVSLLGVATGFACYLAAAVVGLTAVFTLVPALYTVLKLAGAAYLLYLAWQAIRPGGRSPFEPEPLPPDGPWRLYTMGLVTNLLNPKIAVLYVSLLPQFVDPERGHIALQNLILGGTQITVAMIGNTLITLTAGSLAVFLARRPAWMRVQRAFMATVLGGLAVKMAADRSRAAAVTP
ncbi:LysE family translocator [Thermomonospora cellulosilytica]|uniref:Threonine/homoserine/homoserine lactone efflux protein n=1 Tax=Thermomonospora cellulosilytica TaxID=1411118 RepID=A0A7W3N3V3_9ACTN|nr:LysE family translocator [Thermomonospora cellulosilytica]MBA9007039.1 threonine/homoserine/homoserine lactone efflux protein [Thermomonospora cellulosilytica]